MEPALLSWTGANAEVRAGMAKSAATENFILFDILCCERKAGMRRTPRNNVKSAEQSQSRRLSRYRVFAGGGVGGRTSSDTSLKL